MYTETLLIPRNIIMQKWSLHRKSVLLTSGVVLL